ncbi:hypothetical protein ACFE04_023335 [Oxalis oulophora]
MVHESAPKKKRGPTRCMPFGILREFKIGCQYNIIIVGNQLGQMDVHLPIFGDKILFHPAENSTIKAWTLKDISEKWKGWKGNLKFAYFDEVSNVNDIVDEVVAEKGASSERNSTNRSKSDKPHRIGTKSFVRHVEEMAKELKRQPKSSKIYVKTRVCEDETFTSNASRTIIYNINEIQSNETTSEETTMEGGEPSITEDVLARAQTKAQNKRERNGRERCVGLKPPTYGRRRTSHASLINLQMSSYMKVASEKIGMPILEYDGDMSDVDEF